MSAESGVRARTRRAILEAAMRLLPRNPATSVHEIADEAGVGRSTVHRYFDDRADLIGAMAKHIYRLSDAGIARADIPAGPPMAAIGRLAHEQLELGLALDFLVNEKTQRLNPQIFEEFADGDAAVAAAVHAAARPGTDAPEGWEIRVFWALLRLSAEFVDEGVPRHQALAALMDTLCNGIMRADSAAALPPSAD